MLARPLFCAVIALLVAPVLSATVTWTTYTDDTCTTLCPIGTCATTSDTANTCNQNSEASMNNLVCESSLIRYNNFPNTGTDQSTYSACDSSATCFENVLHVGDCQYFPGPVPTWKKIEASTYTCTGSSATQSSTCTPLAPTTAPTAATDSATATATPSAAPTAATKPYSANFEVELTRISSADFDADAQNSFSTVVAANSGSICGSASASTCTSTDVSISSATRRSVTVAFSLGVYSSDSASSAVTTLSAYMGSGNFATDLTASGASGLAGITGTSVTSATTSSSSDSSSGLSTGAIVGIVVGCVFFIVVVAVIIYCVVFKGSKQNDCETGKSNEDCSSNHKEANPIASVPEMGHVNPSKADDHVPDNL